jgi:hypothetical protein
VFILTLSSVCPKEWTKKTLHMKRESYRSVRCYPFSTRTIFLKVLLCWSLLVVRKPEGSLNISERHYALPCESKFRILIKKSCSEMNPPEDMKRSQFSILNFSCCWVRFTASTAVGASSRRLKMACFTGSWCAALCTVVGESVCYQSTTLFSKRIWTITYRASVVVLHALLVVT